MNKLIDEYVKKVGLFVQISNEYIKYSANIIKGHNDDDYDEYIDALDNISKIELNKPKSVEEYIGFFDGIFEIQNNMKKILKIANNEFYMKGIIENMSQTFIESIEFKTGNLNNLYNGLNSLNDIKYFEDNRAFFENYTMNSKKIYNGGNRLIPFLMKLRLNKTSNKTEREFILKMIENLKDNVLQNTTKSENAPIIIRHSLIPVTDSLPMKQLLKDIIQLPKEKCSMIIFDKAVQKDPIEFNILPLISDKYVLDHKLFISDKTTLNDVIIKRYENISLKSDYKLLNDDALFEGQTKGEDSRSELSCKVSLASLEKKPCKKTPKRPDQWSVEWIDGDPLSDKIYILETIDGLTYRILAPALDSLFVSRKFAKKIYSGHNTRAEAYHKIMSEAILEKVYDPKLSNMLSDYNIEKKSIPNLDTLRNNIMYKLINEFPAQKIKSLAGYKKFMDNEDIIVCVIINTLYDIYQIDKNNIEDSLSFLSDVDKISSRFYRQLKKIYEDNILQPRVFTEKTGDILQSFLIDHFKDLIYKAFNNINNSRNSWYDIEFSLKEYVFAKKSIGLK